MARMLRELTEEKEIHIELDGTVSETRFFRVSLQTWDWLHEHGQLAAVSLDDRPGIISVAAFIESDTGWNGWNWLCDEFVDSGLDAHNYVGG